MGDDYWYAILFRLPGLEPLTRPSLHQDVRLEEWDAAYREDGIEK